jgi:DNA-binding NtrC family response regulator
MPQLEEAASRPPCSGPHAVVIGSEPERPANRPVRILVVDHDESSLPAMIRRAFPGPSHEVVSVATSATAVDCVRTTPPDVVLLAPGLADQSGLAVHAHIRALDQHIPVILVASSGAAGAAIEAMKQGAFDYLRWPLDTQQLERVVADALAVATQRYLPIAAPDPSDDGGNGSLVGRSDAMLQVCKAIGLVSARDVAVLITGESGTGKELVARALHEHSARASAPLLALNCAAIPDHLLESDLFGHERGAFTGADRRHIGKFEQCTSGTLFLDEIGDMPLPLQGKILRVLQEQEFQRVGGSETVRTNVRVVAATHRDLRALVAEGKFRADLFYRLAVYSIHLPPLRARGDDIVTLANHFVARYSREFGRDVRAIAPGALARLRAHDWPGNIRELQSVMKQALLRASGPILLPGFLPDLPSRRRDSPPSDGTLDLDRFIRSNLSPEMNDLYEMIHLEVDRLLLARVLDYTSGSQRHAAQLLGIARQTMRSKLRTLAASGAPSERCA